MFSRLTAAICLALLIAAGTGPGAYAQGSGEAAGSLGVQGLADNEVATIKQTIEAWTKDFVSDDFAGWETYWTSDAVLAAPGSDRVVGKAAITAFVQKTFAGTSSFSFDDWAVAGREDLAVVTNTITLEGGASGGKSYNQMIVLRREDSGWRVQSVLFNTPG